MTKILTLRIESELLGKAEARAMQLGLDRAKYIRALIEEDLAAAPRAGHHFASEDLVGIYEGSGHTADHSMVRSRLRAKAGKGCG